MDYSVLETNLFKQYEKMERLGYGEFAEVYLCKNLVDKQTYAVKMIPMKAMSAETHLSLFEVETWSGLDHPNIAHYNHAWIEREIPPFLEDFVSNIKTGSDSSYADEEKEDLYEGWADGKTKKGSEEEKADAGSNSSYAEKPEKADAGSDSSYEEKPEKEEKKADAGSNSSYEEKPWSIVYIAIKRYSYSLNKKIGQLSKEAIEKIFEGLLSALLYLNKMSIVHGDIKPENILLDEEYNPKVADFGSSFVVGGTVKEGGTFGYLRTGEQPSYASDMYAFGLTMLQVICSLPDLGSKMVDIQRDLKNGIKPEKLMKADVHVQVKLTVIKILTEPSPPSIAELAVTLFIIRLGMKALECEDTVMGALSA